MNITYVAAVLARDEQNRSYLTGAIHHGKGHQKVG